MSELISSSLAPAKIFAAAATAARLGEVRGGIVAAETRSCLGEVLELALPNHAALVEARTALAEARQAVAPLARDARLVVGRIRDELWNGLGRPKGDARLALVFPSAGRTAVHLPLGDRPRALRALAARLEAGLHPRLPRERSREAAAEIRAAAEALDQALQGSTAAAAQVAFLADLDRALAAMAHDQLAALKAVLGARGLRSAEIDEVVPTRPSRPRAR